MKAAVYPGTFDPVTNGHLELISRSMSIFDNVIVAVGTNPQKEPLFSLDERLCMIKESVKNISGVSVDSFNGLLVDYVNKTGARAIIRGLRAMSDFEYEFQLALMNRRLDKSIETVFLVPSEEHAYLTSSLIREVARYKGDVASLVPAAVMNKLGKRFG